MTVIFTLGCPAYALQVSDRLVSLRNPGDPKLTEFDPSANKALLFQTHDALVCIGYAGTAYLNGAPTDKWIAEKLWNQKLPIGSDGRTPIQFGHNQNICKFDLAIWKLKCGLETLAPRAAGLWITIAGWQVSRKVLRPVLVELENRRGSSSIRIVRDDKYWTLGVNDFRLHSIGVHPDPEEVRQLRRNLKEKGAYSGNWEGARQVLSEFVRDLSNTRPGVGRSVMSVVIPHPRLGTPEIVFLPEESHSVGFITGMGFPMHITGARFTPWLIGPGILYPPSAVVGDMKINLGSVEVKIAGGPPIGHLIGLSTSQRRPDDPGGV